MRYTFGTDETAARRLEEIAKIFNPLAEHFIRNNLNKPIDTAIDLGCGPGFTTDMLARGADCRIAYGLDNSEAYIAYAGNKFPNLNFIKHDITKTPFPLTADIMYTRFVLAHLRDVNNLLAIWANELNDHGMLFIEEVEDIQTDLDVFKKYLKTNIGLVNSQGADLFVGKSLKYVSTANVVLNESVTIPVKNSQAATWFYPNTLSIWKGEKYILETLAQDEIYEISESLRDIKNNKTDDGDIAWVIRRLVLKKPG